LADQGNHYWYSMVWYLKVHSQDGKCQPPDPILNQFNPVTPSQPFTPRSVLILFSHLFLHLPMGTFPSFSLLKVLYSFLTLSSCVTCVLQIVKYVFVILYFFVVSAVAHLLYYNIYVHYSFALIVMLCVSFNNNTNFIAVPFLLMSQLKYM
jgi:hypothetical protein